MSGVVQKVVTPVIRKVVTKVVNAVTIETITDGDHDGWESSSAVWNKNGVFGSNLAAWGNFSGSGFVSLHFEEIPFNRNVQLEQAELQFYINTVFSGGGTGRIYGELIANASLPDNASNKPSSMTLTTNYAEVPNSVLSSTGTKTIDVRLIMDELLGQASWVNGNAINLICTDNGSGSGEYSAFALSDHANGDGSPLRMTGG